MGTPIIPPPPKAANCAVCFPVDETPLNVWIAITGVHIGSLWIPGMPGCPNQTFKLTQTNPCEWVGAFSPWDAVWYPNIHFGTSLAIALGALYEGFVGISNQHCVYRFTNFNNVFLGQHYYGGEAQVMLLADPPPISMQEIAELINVEKVVDTMCEFWPASNNTVIVRYANVKDRICIYVKHDLS